MAAMLTLTEVSPYNFSLAQILAVTIPACLIGIVVTSLVANRLGKELDEDPEVQRRIQEGLLAPPQRASRSEITRPAPARHDAAPGLS